MDEKRFASVSEVTRKPALRLPFASYAPDPIKAMDQDPDKAYIEMKVLEVIDGLLGVRLAHAKGGEEADGIKIPPLDVRAIAPGATRLLGGGIVSSLERGQPLARNENAIIIVDLLFEFIDAILSVWKPGLNVLEVPSQPLARRKRRVVTGAALDRRAVLLQNKQLVDGFRWVSGVNIGRVRHDARAGLALVLGVKAGESGGVDFSPRAQFPHAAKNSARHFPSQTADAERLFHQQRLYQDKGPFYSFFVARCKGRSAINAECQAASLSGTEYEVQLRSYPLQERTSLGVFRPH